jgi:hypothetical protein
MNSLVQGNAVGVKTEKAERKKKFIKKYSERHDLYQVEICKHL